MTSRDDQQGSVGADADDALDHALRERPVDDEADYAYDDAADAGTEQLAPADADQPPPDGNEPLATDGDDGEDYVLYSEVRPHLEALVALQNERDKMIDLLLYARDRVSSPAVASRMDDNLAQLGIHVILPQVGDRFDPQQHEASATVFTEDADQHGAIAEIELAGYVDGDRMVRHPIVTVYTTDRGGA